MKKVLILILASILPISLPAYELIGTIDGQTAGEQFGSAVCMVDFNDDGYSDLVVAAPASDDGGISSGKVYIYYGGPTIDLMPDLEFVGPAGSFFGKAVSSAGDFNNDGSEDLLIGAPFYDLPSNNAGAVFLFYGGETPNAIADHVFTGLAAGDYFGTSITNCGDFNNDTYDDIAIGSYKVEWGGFTDAGMVYVYFGGPGPDFVVDRILVGDGDGERFGYSLSSGDFDNNGSTDIAVGAYSYDDTFLNQGRIYIFNGGTFPDTLYDMAASGNNTGYKFGWALSSGDINNDGYFDVLMGTDGYSIDTFETGKIYVFNGNEPPDEIPDAEYSLNRTSNDYLGFAVGSGTDLNNDGNDDIIVGMPGNDDFAEDAGGVVVIYGGSSLSVDTTFLGTGAGEELGKCVGFWTDYDDGGNASVVMGTSSYDNYRGRISVYSHQAPDISGCGDANADGSINILDVTFLILYLYKGGPEPDPMENADVNSSGSINLLDVTYLISYLYKGGPNPNCNETL